MLTPVLWTDGAEEMEDKPAAKAAAKRKADSDEEEEEEEKPVVKKQKTEVSTPAAKSAPAAGESTTCFVGNLSWNSTEDSIKAHFKGAGKVVSVRIGELRVGAHDVIC